ncbi:hypothetical protein [Hymenobacter sp. B81]|uniref:hypothetical protein n=1 Tax=Hymenobacter sp. B81 TaxID=3344878 RepID=UPI0037DDADAA
MGRAELVAARTAALLPAVPYAALRQLEPPRVAAHFVQRRFEAFGQGAHEHVARLGTADEAVEFLYADLPWDSQFFAQPSVRLHAALFGPGVTAPVLAEAARQFTAQLGAVGTRHAYAEVPAEDTALLYALGRAGWSVVETRLQYVHEHLDQLREPRYAVRAAAPDEAELIRAVSARNRNLFDRFHADPAYSPEQADAFLGEYAAAAVRGYCDTVLVPAAEVVDSFLAISYLAADAAALDTALGRVVLTAVGPANRGWHRRLVSETLYHTRERGGRAVLMTTQATNRAVVHNAEQLGFRLGGVTLVLSAQPAS